MYYLINKIDSKNRYRQRLKFKTKYINNEKKNLKCKFKQTINKTSKRNSTIIDDQLKRKIN